MISKSKALLFIPLLALCGGCAANQDQGEDTHAIGRRVTKMEGEPNMYDVAENDSAMAQATRHARRTVGQFITALQHPGPGMKDFQVKKLFVKDGKGEHIWLANVKFIGNRFVGVVDNRPVNIPGLKVGMKVAVNPDEIFDWPYVDNGQLVGGYTIRVLFGELSPQEKAAFEKQADFHIGAPQTTATHP